MINIWRGKEHLVCSFCIREDDQEEEERSRSKGQILQIHQTLSCSVREDGSFLPEKETTDRKRRNRTFSLKCEAERWTVIYLFLSQMWWIRLFRIAGKIDFSIILGEEINEKRDWSNISPERERERETAIASRAISFFSSWALTYHFLKYLLLRHTIWIMLSDATMNQIDTWQRDANSVQICTALLPQHVSFDDTNNKSSKNKPSDAREEKALQNENITDR